MHAARKISCTFYCTVDLLSPSPNSVSVKGLSPDMLDDFCFCQRRIAICKSNMWGNLPHTLSRESYTRYIPIVSVARCNPTGTGDTVRHLA